MNKKYCIFFVLILIASISTVNASDLNDINDNFQEVTAQNDAVEVLSLSNEDDLQGTWYKYEFYDSNISDAEAEFGQEEIELSLNSNFRKIDRWVFDDHGGISINHLDTLVGGSEWYEEYTGVKICIDEEEVLATTVVDGNNTLKVNISPMINAGMHQIKTVLTK